MNKFVGKWKMLLNRSDKEIDPHIKNNIYTIHQVRNDMMMIHSEWETTDDRSGFRGYTIHPDGIPRKASGSDLKYVTKVRGQNKLTTSKIEDEQVKSMEIREVLDSGELKVTQIRIRNNGEQEKKVVYYRKVEPSA